MSSNRFPGKVLAPLRGKPLISHVIDRCTDVEGICDVILLTSKEKSDDPLCKYLEFLGHKFFRGSLLNVFYRYQAALKKFPCDYVVRICGDSPLLSVDLMNYMIDLCISNRDKELFSNVFLKTFPKGQSIEIIKSKNFENIDSNELNSDQREHVFPYFYDRIPNKKSVLLKQKFLTDMPNYCVDIVEDLSRLHNLSEFKFVRDYIEF